MRILILCSILLMAGASNAQKLRFQISGQSDTTVHLIRYFGKGLYYADTGQMENGLVEFDGSKQKPGILALFLPGQKLLEFIYNEEPELFIESDMSDLMGMAKVKKSEENKIFLGYAQYIAKNRKELDGIVEQRKAHEEGSKEYKKFTDEIDAINEKVAAYQQDIIDNYFDKLVGKLIYMSQDIEVPEAPENADGTIDSTFRFKYFRAHYWDHVDFKDDRLMRTPIFHNKLEKFFGEQMMVQHWDSVIFYAYWLCDQLDPSSDMYQYCVTWITSTYEKSKIMGMDKVFVYMARRYYCGSDEKKNPKAHWVSEDKLVELCDRAETMKNLVLELKPPNIILKDTTGKNWRDFYSLESEYTLLYFWDPECGHCKKITPKLQTLYEKKLAERNVEIFAVGKAVGEDFEKWKKFIRENNLQFINVAVTDKLYRQAKENARPLLQWTTLESLNYQATYDVYSTPKVFILDKDKKIIAKSLSVSQIEEFLDDKQGFPDAEKLFPPEEEPIDEKIT